MLENYFPILLFLAIGVAVGLAPIVLSGGLSRVLGTYKPTEEKLSPYECGFEAFEDARMKFDVRYYLVDRKSTRLNSSHIPLSRMPSSA